MFLGRLAADMHERRHVLGRPVQVLPQPKSRVQNNLYTAESESIRIRIQSIIQESIEACGVFSTLL